MATQSSFPLVGVPFALEFICDSAGAAGSAGKIVALTGTAGHVDINADATVKSYGVVANPDSWSAGDTVQVVPFGSGPFNLRCGGAIAGNTTVNGEFMAGTGGKAVAFSSGGGNISLGHVVGYTNQSTTADGDLVLATS